MNWKSEMDELRRREEFAEQLGGPERVERQHAGGRYTVRERIAKLVDPGSFHELGKIAGSASYDARNDLEKLVPSNFVFGRARLDGRPGGDRRGRLHRARRLGGRHHQGQALPVRADGQGAAPAAGADRRGLGWGRLRQDHRDDGPRQCPRRVGLGAGGRQHGHGAAGRARPRLGGGARRRASRRRALLRDGQGHLRALRGGPAGGRTARAEAHEERAGRLADPAPRGRGRHGGRHGRGGLRVREALPVLLAVLRLRPAAARPA